jgi:hypothetical protein
MQQRLSITVLSQALKLDPFYGDDRRVVEICLSLRRQLIQPPMTFRFIGTIENMSNGANVRGTEDQGKERTCVWQAELIHAWCGLARLETYEPRQEKSTGWFGWDWVEYGHGRLEIDRDQFKRFLRNKILPLPSFWFPETPDNSQRWRHLAANGGKNCWDELVLLGRIEDEIAAWRDMPAASVTERLERDRQVERLQKQRAAVLTWLNPPYSPRAASTATQEIGGPYKTGTGTGRTTDPPSVFQKSGDFWQIAYRGEKSTPLKDSLGLQYIAFLLANPHREIHVAELAYALNGHRRNGHPVLGKMQPGKPNEDGLSVSLTEETEPLLDTRAKEEFRKRLEEIRQALHEAMQHNDLPRITNLNEEQDFLQNELKRAVGIGGKNRKTKNTNEKIRKAVTNRISAALKRLTKRLPPLGQHLSNAIRTGTFCSYCPEKKIPWKL